MPARPDLRTRQIHLDFHTGPAIGDVGSRFDARAFARTMQEAHVNSVTVFAKCHHGHLYYNTRHPARHPGLRKGLDLLGQQIDALHHLDIRAPIYLSVQCDEYAADTYPQWVARHADGKPVGAGPLSPGWQILDMASPYQDYLAEQLAEILKLFKPVDGLFFDMCWDQPSLGNHAVEAMLRAGLNPELEADRNRHAHQVALGYMKRFYRMVKAASPQATVYFNSRPLHNLAEEIPFLTQTEIEALPTGGWGYLYFPTHVRFARTFARPYLGMTARFHKSWADFGGLKPYPALEYETSQMMAHGAACSIGDQLHPRGTLDPAAYQLIGSIYRRVADREPWLQGAKPVVQIGVVRPARTAQRVLDGQAGGEEGAVRVLTQLKHQFDLIDAGAKLNPYDLVVLPDTVSVDSELAARLDAHVQAGGALLVSGSSALNAEANASALPCLPVRPLGPSPFQTTYLRFSGALAADIPATDHVMYERGIRVKPAPGARAMGVVVEPYFDRNWKHFCSHSHTPPDKATAYPIAVCKGRVAYIAYPVFTAVANHGNYPYRLLVRNVLNLLLPEPLLRVEAPTSTEATVMRQKGRTIIHLLHYSAERRTARLDLIEDIVPLYNVELSLLHPRKPRRVYLAPELKDIPWTHQAGRVHLTIPALTGHAMAVVE